MTDVENTKGAIKYKKAIKCRIWSFNRSHTLLFPQSYAYDFSFSPPSNGDLKSSYSEGVRGAQIALKAVILPPQAPESEIPIRRIRGPESSLRSPLEPTKRIAAPCTTREVSLRSLSNFLTRIRSLALTRASMFI